LSCHDLSEGGLGLSLSEMAFSGDIGVEVSLDEIIYTGTKRRFDYILFSESNSRFLIEVDRKDCKKIEELFKDLPLVKIGTTIKEKNLRVFANNKKLIDLPLSIIKAKWQRKVV
jgi:phosphoribosylformylglycinamidine synthase